MKNGRSCATFYFVHLHLLSVPSGKKTKTKPQTVLVTFYVRNTGEGMALSITSNSVLIQ